MLDESQDSRSTVGRNAAIVGSVVLMHAAALWIMNQGLLRPPPPPVIVPAEILAEFIAPPAPPPPAPPAPAPPAPIPPPKPPEPPKPKARPKPKVIPKPKPVVKQSVAVESDEPSSNVAETASAEPTPPAPPPPAAPSSPPGPPAPPAEPVIRLPSSDASYLNNPKPAYPSVSRRLGESGRVIIRVLIGIDGRAKDAHIERSSGFPRLDNLALETARDRWRYVPGKRNGVPEQMWFNVPFNFILEQ